MASDGPSEQVCILLVDANACAATYLRDSLLKSGYAVRLVTSAECASSAIEAEYIDLILIDLLLPDADGLILCSTLRARTGVPIVMLSARPRAVDEVLAMELGASQLVSRPVDLCHLQSVIEALLAGSAVVESVGSTH